MNESIHYKNISSPCGKYCFLSGVWCVCQPANQPAILHINTGTSTVLPYRYLLYDFPYPSSRLYVRYCEPNERFIDENPLLFFFGGPSSRSRSFTLSEHLFQRSFEKIARRPFKNSLSYVLLVFLRPAQSVSKFCNVLNLNLLIYF